MGPHPGAEKTSVFTKLILEGWGKYPKIDDFVFNTKQAIKHQFFFNIFDRIRYFAGIEPDYNQGYFLRMQLTRHTVRGKSRKLKAKWTAMDE